MNINKHDPETDMEMEMTPMIDVVFLLIIFFILITDMSQADLEDLQLPKAENADPDKPDPTKPQRPVLNINHAGVMKVKREEVFNPEANAGDDDLKKFIYNQAANMSRAPIDETNPGGDTAPDEPLLIRADQNTPFKYIQKVMEICGVEDIKLWKLQLAASEGDKEDEKKE